MSRLTRMQSARTEAELLQRAMQIVEKPRTRQERRALAQAYRTVRAEDAAQPMTAEQAAHLGLHAETSLDAVRTGTATQKHLAELLYAANVSRLLAEMGIGAEGEHVAERGQQAAKSLTDRWVATGQRRAIATGGELGALRDMLDVLHDQFALQPTEGQMREIVDTIKAADAHAATKAGQA